jgi:very-short-patch-repair endonuclease
VVTVAQLLASGLTESGIRRRVTAGRLHRIHRGVYAVGHAGLSPKGRWKGATLACGPGAALSHRSAAELWGLLEHANGLIHVTVPVAGGRAKRGGLRIHRLPSLTRSTTTLRDGIPVTRPARTLTDLRGMVPPGDLRRAVRQAEVRGLPIDSFLLVPDRTTSELERIFLQLCRRHRLPRPEVNVRIGSDLVDFLWRERRLIVETDGYRYHRGAIAFEDDHARDNRLMALGYDVLRFTYWRVVNEPEAVLALLRSRLARERWRS